MKEKVVFRMEHNPYRGGISYLAIFPECSANRGFYAAVPFYFDNEGRAVFEPFCELAYAYYYGDTRIVHKSDGMIEKLLSAIENQFGESFSVCERIHS